MADELSEDELELLRKHRAQKAKSGRKVKVRGKHDESGAEYEFDLDGDDAERVIARHRALFAEQEEVGDTESDDTASASKRTYFKGTQKKAAS